MHKPASTTRCASGARNGPAGAFVQLGRASHLLIDMACPVHVHRVPHWTDGYEWAVESHADTLGALPFDIAGPYASARDTVAALARFTQQFEPDRTHHLWGRALHSLGLRRSLPARELAEQAQRIIPVAAGHLAALYLQFFKAAEVA